MKFIYVFNKKDRDLFIAKGYTLLSSNEEKDIYVFDTDGNEREFFDLENSKYVYSNVLTF